MFLLQKNGYLAASVTPDFLPSTFVSGASNLPDRVTRLGDFSPNGRLFTLGSNLKVSDLAHGFGLHFFFKRGSPGRERTRVLSISFILSFSPLYR
jgi:hypothetical protein